MRLNILRAGTINIGLSKEYRATACSAIRARASAAASLKNSSFWRSAALPRISLLPARRGLPGKLRRLRNEHLAVARARHHTGMAGVRSHFLTTATRQCVATRCKALSWAC